MTPQELLKTASTAIKGLKASNEDALEKVSNLEASLEHFKQAKDLTFKLMKMGAFPSEDVEEQFNRFLETPNNELETFEKAANLIKEANGENFFSLGKLSNDVATGYGSAAERFIAELLED